MNTIFRILWNPWQENRIQVSQDLSRKEKQFNKKDPNYVI